MMASEKPRSSMTRASRMYITPMRLWSTEVIQSRHSGPKYPLTIMNDRTATITRTMKAVAPMMIG